MNQSEACCTSCAFSPGHAWTTIAKMGGVITSPNGKRQSLTHLELCQIANTYCSSENKHAPVSLNGETELPAKMTPPQGFPACAWVRGLRVLRGELQAQIDWLPSGKKLLASGHTYLTPIVRFDSRATEGANAGQIIGAKLSSVALSKIPTSTGAQRVTMKSSHHQPKKEHPLQIESQAEIADRLAAANPTRYARDPALLAADAFTEHTKARVTSRDGVGPVRQFPNFRRDNQVVAQRMKDENAVPPPPGSSAADFAAYNDKIAKACTASLIADVMLADRIAPEGDSPASYVDANNRIMAPLNKAAAAAREASRLAMGDLVDQFLREGDSLALATSKAFTRVAAAQVGANVNDASAKEIVDAPVVIHGPDNTKPRFSATVTPAGDNAISIRFEKPIDEKSLRRLQALLESGNY